VTESSPAAVLDASALLALLNKEPGGEQVAALAGDAAISTVNWCEAFGKLRAAGVRGAELRSEIAETGLMFFPFTRDDAEAAGELGPRTRRHGLSLADRACIALASRLGVPAVTADRAWLDLDIDVEIVSLR
jgi:PIN domain nuclease of toxin-antitoxin system